jgi:hypothetical protein
MKKNGRNLDWDQILDRPVWYVRSVNIGKLNGPSDPGTPETKTES